MGTGISSFLDGEIGFHALGLEFVNKETNNCTWSASYFMRASDWMTT
jgi:hypothetical protein